MSESQRKRRALELAVQLAKKTSPGGVALIDGQGTKLLQTTFYLLYFLSKILHYSQTELLFHDLVRSSFLVMFKNYFLV